MVITKRMSRELFKILASCYSRINISLYCLTGLNVKRNLEEKDSYASRFMIFGECILECKLVTLL